ncbi:hypothetical protein SLEP1_g31620 [Rubroshorea leprosula]|uniref:RNase H type-1 domain-containing protein n=1 Tax=Rubroshorea leprosula TaxID=152421 RepID=A0AAV5KAQ4_9ROSI|nr:hypothetical protein SLEP1_g31620 [Rubroshorea leprosula]
MQHKVMQALNISQVITYDKYLGLPLIIGRKKSICFDFVLERVWSKIKGWKTKLLSRAGKEILIKAVVQAILTYCMGCFKLPQDFLQSLNSIISNFWCGDNTNKWRIHWTRPLYAINCSKPNIFLMVIYWELLRGLMLQWSKCIYNHTCLSPGRSIQDIRHYIKEYKAATTTEDEQLLEAKHNLVVAEKVRTLPPNGVVKINVDASIPHKAGMVSLGVVLRDSNGRVLGASKKTMSFQGGITHVEILAICFGV